MMERRTVAIGLLATLALLASACAQTGERTATAKSAAAPAPVRTAQASPAAGGKLCRVASTGTLIPKRVCKTPAEWAQFDQENGRTLEEIRRIEQNKCAMGQRC